ncbi:MAG TPA: xanthine dehydrogenase family protein subunit M [Acidimicrobiales bacterium]|nr:xanthine dehydrogenase family protein subunit M [Acidimicrobiales bacterium]
MIPASFEYRRASSVEEALGWLAEDPDSTKLQAGGHSLLPLMKLRLATPGVIVDVGRIPRLSYVRDGGDHVAIGALTRHRDLEISEVARAHVPLLAHVAGQVGDPQVRHRGTIGGSLAHGDPASDLPAVVLALDGTMVIDGPRGRREVPATDFFRGFLETALEPDEMLVEVRLHKAPVGWGFQKFNRRAQDWAIVGVAAVVNGDARVALVNMGSTTVRARGTEEALGAGAGISEAASRAAEGLEPPSDLNGSAEYRRHLATVLVRRALEEATAARG